MGLHLLNLRSLADADPLDYALLRFDGREAISEPFDWRLELISTTEADLSAWIGKLVEFDVSPNGIDERVFAGRIYAAQRAASGGMTRIILRARPAYHALAYGRATHFVQDKNSLDIFAAMTADVPGLVTSVSVAPSPPKRGYSVRYDESEIDYLARLLAQDGIMYFFVQDRAAGSYHHKMIVTNKASDYVDVAGGAVDFFANASSGTLKSLSHEYRAAPRKHDHYAFNVNKLDTPSAHNAAASDSWGTVYSHSHETTGDEVFAEGDLANRSSAHNEAHAQGAEVIEGSSDSPAFCAGGRLPITNAGTLAPGRVVLTSVTHSAYDPWMIAGAMPGSYSNNFTAMDATKVFRPAVGVPQRKAPGPLLGTIEAEGTVPGEAKVDEQWRVPVAIAKARDYAGAKPLPKIVWLPVQQQWAHSTHGAQFFPRIGTRVIIDFLYGNPDLPFVSGTVYTPSQAYPFDPASKVTQTGWRSVTDKNGAIMQEFHFEDKPGSEEIYLYTGRDYRRLIDNDDFGTVKHDQTLIVENDQKLDVTNDRTVTITGKQKTDITGTRTVTVTAKSLLESKEEIEFKVGASTITMTASKIVIKSPTIEIKADAKLDMSAGGVATLKAPKTDVTADAMLTLKGGIVMIN